VTVSKKFKNAVIITIAVLIISVFAPPIQADEPLKSAPADTLFYVQINNLDYTLSQTDQFLAGVSPIPLGLQMIVRMQLAQMLGNPALPGLNTAGGFAVFATVEGGELNENSITILAPVSNYSEFISSNTNLSEPDPNGISEIKNIGGFVTQIGSFAAIKPPGAYDRLIAEKKSLSSGSFESLADVLDTTQKSEAANTPLWVYCNMELVNKTFGQQIAQAFEEMQKQMEQMPAGMQSPMQNPAEIMKIYYEGIKAFLDQSKSVTLSLTPKPDVLKISETVTALPQTALAELFTKESTAKTDNKLLYYLKDGSMFNMTGNICSKYNTLGMDFFMKIFGKNITEEQKERINNYLTNYANVFSGSFAGSFTITPKNQPIFAAEAIYEVKDKTKFDEVMKEGMTFLEDSGMTEFYKNMGLDISSVYAPDVDSYKGFSINSAKFTMKVTDVDSPEAQQMAQMIEKMYGEGFETRWALVNNLCVYAMGANADTQIKKLIDEVTNPGSKEICSEIKAATALLPGSENADLFMTFNLLRIFKAIPDMMEMMQMPMSMPEMDFETISNFVIAANTGENKLTVDVAIPKQHLMEIMQAVQMMMIHSQQMQASRNATMATLKTLHNAVINFKMDTGRYPTKAEGLKVLIEKPANVENYPTGGYIGSTQLPKDSWGNDFLYELEPEDGTPFLIRSCGPDGKPKTSDDLLSTDNNGC